MTPLAPIPPAPQGGQLATLESILDELCRFGSPRLFCMGGGWYAACEMYVTAVGAKFEVKSEFAHTSPTEAALLCLSRVRAAVAAASPKP